ncbi:hypothetical protein ACFW04_014528 [Cataglyphis niger]
MWFKNVQDANMQLLRWRLKLAEYDYEVVYKAGKTNVNADALSRNPINLEEVDCKIIKQTLDPNDPEDAQLIAEMFEKSDSEEEEKEEKEDDDFHFYLSDIEDAEEVASGSNLINNNNNTLLFTSAELDEPDCLTITEKALIHNPYKPNKIQTRINEPHDNGEEIQEIIEGNDPPDKISEDEEETEEDIINQNLKAGKIKPTIIENRTIKSNIIDSRKILFLRKDNVAYFVDTQGKPLDSDSQKLFERNGLSNLGSLY